MTEHEAYVGFNLTERVGSVAVAGLVARFGSVAAAWAEYPKKKARAGGEVDIAAEERKAKEFGVVILTPADAGYPKILLKESSHPLALYVKGRVEALSKPALALVGTRRADDYGLVTAEELSHDLAAGGWMIVSGLALGIDAAAHRGALAAGGVTVGVLGSALDRFYPQENRELAREIVAKGGAVVSEFPFGREPDTQTFPQRNRTVATLARGVIAVQAPVKSGTLITAALAVDLGRTVMAVPARIRDRLGAGCLKLLRDGARLIRNAEDVFDEMSELLPRSRMKPVAAEPDARREPPAIELPAVTLEESLVLKAVDEDGVSVDRVVSVTGLPPAKVSALCMALRLKGRLRYLPGNRVALPLGFR